jgi:hypothetical protein
VITQLTMPNVLANLTRLPHGCSRPTTKFYAGDWHTVGQLLSSKVSALRVTLRTEWHLYCT